MAKKKNKKTNKNITTWGEFNKNKSTSTSSSSTITYGQFLKDQEQRKKDYEREQEEEARKRQQEEAQKEIERVARQNRITVSAGFGKESEIQPKNKLTDILGPVKTYEGGWKEYTEYLKEKNKKNDTLSGTKLEGPVVDQEQALENYKKQVEEKKRKQDEENKKTQNIVQSVYGKTTDIKSKSNLPETLGEYKTNQGALNSWLKDLKEKKNTLSGQNIHGPIDQTENIISRLLTNRAKINQEDIKSIQGGYQGYDAAKDKITKQGQEQYGVKTYNDYMQGMLRKGAKGELNNGGNPLFMNEEGIKAYKKSAAQEKARADTMQSDFIANRNAWKPEQNWSSIFDMLESWDEYDAESVLHRNHTLQEDTDARNLLKEMQGTRAERKQDMLDNASLYFDQFNQNMWQNDWENATDEQKEQLREIMYDDIMPDRYADRVARMTPAQKNQFDAAFDEMLGVATGTDLRWENKEYEYNNLIKSSKEKTQKAEEAENFWKEYKYFTDWANDYGTEGSPFRGGPLDGSYDPSLVQLEDKRFSNYSGQTIKSPTGSRVDKAYYYMNNVPELGKYGNAAGTEQKEYFATPEMVDTFNKLYKYDKQNGSNMAEQFLDGIDYFLTSSQMMYQDYSIRQMSEDPLLRIPMRVGTYVTNAAMAIPNMVNTGLALLGSKGAADKNNRINQINRFNQTIREHQNQKADDAVAELIPFMKNKTNFLLNVGDSIIDNVVAMGTAKALVPDMMTSEASQKLGMRVVQLIMSGEATGNTFVQKLQQGAEPKEAALYAIGDGLIEWITERVSLETLLQPEMKSIINKPGEIAKFIGKTTAAEGSEEIAADFLNWGLDYILSMAYGHRTELEKRTAELMESGMEKNEAWTQALKEKVEQIGMSGLAGAISGGVMGIGRVGLNTINQTRTGSATQNNQYNGKSGTEALLDIANETKGETSLKLAKQIQEQIDKGEKVSNKKVGQLAQAIQVETSEKMNDGGIAEYLDGMDTLRSVAEITGQIKAKENKESRLQWAKPAEVQELEQQGKQRVKGIREAIYYDEKTGEGSFTKIDGIESVKDKDGKWELKLKVTANGEQKTVSVNQIQLTDYKAAKILLQADENPEYFSAKYTEALLDAAEKGQLSDVDATMRKQMREAKLVRLYAYAGENADKLNLKYLPKEVQNSLWMESAEEHRQNRLEQVKDAGRQKNAKIQYKGVEYGTDAWKKLDLDKNIKAQMDVIAGIAQRAGVNVDFEELTDEKLYGWENKKRIGINVNGINFDTITGDRSGRHHMLVTFGHEFTHWLMQNSLNGYNRLEQYVMKTLIQQVGENNVMNIIENYRLGDDHLNLEDAVAEIVAQASDAVLMDENVIRHIQETDGKLYMAVKGFVKDLVGKLKNAIQLMPESQSRISKALAGYANELNKLWMGAYDEALSGIITEETGAAEDVTRMSRAEMPDGTKYLVIDTDQALFDNTDTRDYPRIVERYITQKYRGTVIGNDNRAYVDRKSAKEYSHPVSKGITSKKYNAKVRTSTELENLMDVATFVKHVEDDGRHEEAIGGWDVYEAIIYDPIHKKYYQGEINIEKVAKGDRFHDFTKLEDVTKDMQGRIASLNSSNISNKNISHNTEISNTRNSRAQLDNAYMAAVESGDEINQIRYVEEAARRAGYKDLAYHGTKMFGFTNFDMIAGQGMAFVAYNERLAKSYTTAGELRNISSRTGIPVNFYTLNDSKLAEYVKDIFNRWGMMGVTSVRKIEGGENKSDVDLFEVKHKNDWEKNETTSKYRRFELYQALEEYTNPNAELDGIYQLYTKPKNQLVIDAEGKLWNEIPFDLYGVKVGGSIDEETYEYTDTEWDEDFDPDIPHDVTANTREIAKWAKAHGYDSVRINNVSDNGGRNIELYNEGAEQVYGDIGIFFNENDIKSADPIVYDDNGNVIPLSERFNDQKSDIRWSRADVEETKDLIAYHNLGPEQLMAVLRLGGFAMPSIAITRDNYVNDRYGDITVLFRKDTIDPKKSSANKVYGGDAWTPVYPSVEYKISKKVMDAVKKKISKLVPSKYQIRLYELDAEDVEKKVNSYSGDIVKAVKDNTNLMAAYLADKGEEVNYPMREKRLDGFNKFDNQQVIRAYNLLGDETIINAYEMGNTYQYLKEHPEIVNALRDEMNAYWKEELDRKVSKETKLKLLNKALYDESNFGTNQAEHLIEAAYKYMKQGIQSELDSYALQDSLRKQIEADEAGYENWLKDQLNGAIEKSGIRNNKDFFDRMGNRRSWETLHDPETLENVVRVMKAELDKGATGFFAQSELLALGTKDFRSLDEIRKDKGRLQHISDEEMSAAKTEIVNRFDQLVSELADPRESNQFIERDRVYSAIADVVRTARSVEGIQRIMNEWRYKVTAEQAQEIADLMVEISNLPTEYFEAKPKRAVGLDEIAKVIVPENTDQALLDAMDDQGIPWEFYDGTSEDRLAKMNANEDVKFSRWTDSGMDVNLWMKNATPSTVMTEDERVLLQAYNDMRIKMDLSLRKQMDYKAKIRQLEGKADLTQAQKDDLRAARNRLQIEQDKYARMEDEMFQVTNGEGFAAVMYRENMKLKDYIQGKTQDQVKQAIDEMLKLVNRTQEQLTKDTEDLKKLATHQAVQTMKSFMGKTSLGRMAGILRKTYNSNMNKKEIEDRLAEMALKKASGQDITADTEALAQDLLDKMRGIRTDALESLRGQTLVIGQSLAEELKKENSSIKELQSRIKGSGVKIQTGIKSSTGEIDKHSRISEQWKELREKNGALPDVENMAEIDKLHTIVDFIESELRASTGAEQFNIDFDEVAAMVRASVGNVTTYLVDDPTARAQINNLMKQIADLSKATEKTAADMQQLYQQMDDVVLAGQKAKGWATILQRDVTDAIKYYNTTARVAAEKERTKVRKALIQQLRSETAQKLVAQQEKFREQMANEKKARELQQDNEALRSKISTVSTRMANRIFAETDQKNVPEETKGLVRQVLNMISQHDGFFRKVTYWDKQQVDNVRQRLTKMISNYGAFDPDTDLDWLVVKTEDPRDNDYTARDKVEQDLVDIETGLMEYRNAEGQGRISLADRKAALTKVQEALSEIWNVIKARSEMEIAGRKWQVIELAEWMRGEMDNSRFKGERKGFGSRARNTVSGAVTWGNLTPEYFFKNLKNRAMDQLHKGLKIAENRSGLEAAKAKERMAQISQEDGFASWDGQEEHKVQTRSGEITMTTEQIMALYATWLRESSQMRPEDTAHLLNGGFVLAEKENNKGLPGREKRSTRPIRMSKDQLNALNRHLTQEQTKYVHDMVAYMSGELAELGNEASMKMYGIKKFTEQFYYPIKSWGGVLNKRSDAGIASNNENRAAQQGFSKRVKNNASNAIEIGDFTPTAIKHVAGMITYNTVGPAIENLNKVLNQQLQYGEVKYTPDGEEVDLDDTYKLNMRAAFENAYGKQAADYLAKFMKDMNGGVTTERNAFDKLLSIFKKNAVAGSLSVAAQQPLSYIRAAMMINPKYLAAAISPQYWKGSFAEMMKHSGLAVIKQMGKFDMNFGQTMQEWITPEGMESKARKAWNMTTDLITGLPGAMDAMTWTRMWTAVKLEQMAQNKGMDFTSDEFMAKVAERFNDLMRQTQVYDSVMTKSQNMRSQHWYAKTLTSFMAEPTLSLNVLADAMQNIKEKGGKLKAAKAVAIFLLSAAAQAGAKAFFGTGRSPDKKKNKEENFLNKFAYNLLSEANPLGLIPGYRQIVETLTDGEMKDDTMGMIAKAGEVVENIFKLTTGQIGKKGLYRDLEDSIGQMLQLTTEIPAKNIMRDFRAMVNFFRNGGAQGFTGDTYADRPTSQAMLKYQLLDTLMTNDMIGLINSKLADAGYQTTNAAYYQRIVDAEKSGNQTAADQMKEYLVLKSNAEDPEKQVNDAIRKLYKTDDDLSAEERYEKQKEYGLKNGGSFITDEYEAGNLTRKEAEKLYRQENPKASDKDVLKTFDKIDWEKSGKDPEGYTNYTPLYEAIGNNKSDEIRAAADHMLKNGYTKDEIKKQLTTKYKQAYLDAKGSEKTRLMDALTKAYKAIGMTAEEALKIINGWKPKKEKN